MAEPDDQSSLPTADEVFGPAPPLPTADEFFGAPEQAERNRYRQINEGTIAPSPLKDFLLSDTGPVGTVFHSAGRVLDAFGHGVNEAGPATGLSDETKATLKRWTGFDNWSDTSKRIAKAASNVLLEPSAYDLSLLAHAGQGLFSGGQAAVAQLGEELGQPRLGRELAAMPEAFMGSPHPTGAPAGVGLLEQLRDARELGVIGPRGEAAYRGAPAPVERPPPKPPTPEELWPWKSFDQPTEAPRRAAPAAEAPTPAPTETPAAPPTEVEPGFAERLRAYAERPSAEMGLESTAREQLAAARKDFADVSAAAPLPPGITSTVTNSPYIDKAGNIRLDLLEAPEDVKQVIRDAAVTGGGFMEERRGVISDAQVLDLADALGMDAATLNRRQIGEAFNAEQIVAARKLLVQSATEVRDAMLTAAQGNEADLMAFALARDRHLLIQEQVAGITAEAGRALRAFRALSPEIKQARELGNFLRSAELHQSIAAETGLELHQLKAMAQRGASLQTPRQVSQFIHNSTKPTFGDMALEYWINGLISGPATHTTYAIGNELLALWKAGPETAAAAAIGSIRHAFGGAAERVRFGEVPAQLYGLFNLRRGVVAAWEALKSGRTTALPGELQGMSAAQMARSPLVTPRAAIPGTIGSLVRLPSRAIATIHSFFRAVNYERELGAIAYRTAAAEGLEGNALARRMGDVLTNPTEEMMQQARTSATDLTLMGRGGELTRALSQLTNAKFLGFQWLKFIDPFVHISSNVIEQALLQRTVLGVLDPEIRANLAGVNGAIARDQQIARMAVGSALGVAVGSLAAEGLVNGSGPSDPKEASLYTMVNGPPHSVRIGDMWYDIHRLGPLGMQLSVAADLYEVAHVIDTQDAAHIAHAISHAFTQNILDESFMRGPADLIKALSDPDRYGAGWVRNFLSSFVPYSVGMSQIAHAIDPDTRQARTLMDAVKAKVPWLSQTLMPRRDIFGEIIPSKDALGAPGLSAIYEQRVNNDPVARAMLDAGYFPAMPQRKIRGVELTDQQYDDYARIAGKTMRMQLEALVQPGFEMLPQFVRHEIIQKIVTGAHQIAASAVMAANPDIIRGAMDAKTAKLH